MTADNPFRGHVLRSPDLTTDDAERLAAEWFGVAGRAGSLGSHQDQNFRMDTDRGRYVLKVANPGFGRLALEAQNAAMAHIARSGAPFDVPHPRPAVDGAHIVAAHCRGDVYDLRLLTYLDGQPLSDAGYLAPPVLRAMGALSGHASAALADFSHPGTERVLQWDCRHAADVVAALSPHTADPARRATAERAMEQATAVLEAAGPDLRVQVVHGDVTDYNVVSQRDSAGRPMPGGLIDFGDLSRTWLASDPAVTVVALLRHDLSHPLRVAAETLRGFHGVVPLAEAEVDAFWALVAARAALCAVSSEQQALLDPDNAYAATSRDGDWAILHSVDAVPFPLARAALRDAVGLPPVRAAGRTGRAAAAAARAAHPVVPGPAAGRVTAVDLSVTTDELAPGAWHDADAVAAAVARAAGDGLAVRPWAQPSLVDAGGESTQEPESVHLGTDVFAPEGTTVAAPVEATVSGLESEGVALACDDFALVLRGLRPAVGVGARVAPGQTLGWVAARRGDLPPHVHVQLCADPELCPPSRSVPSLAPAWLALCPDPAPLLGLPAGTTPTGTRDDAAALLARRDAVLARVQEHYFDAPPRIERGWRHHLYDSGGRTYLDMVNNVAVLGHSHPSVERAAARQLRLLNTNSRFLYASVVDFAERLTRLLPAPLDTVFCVSTGSEANDLALRLIRIATGHRDVLAVRSAYHGWTSATDEVSTSTSDNPVALSTRPPWVHLVASPNTYRGAHRGADAAARYADDVRRVLSGLRQQGRGIAGFVAEALYGNAGGLPLPDGYLADVYAQVREAGGLCVADEVQVGYGRLGHWFWAFEQQGVVPDVVTLAKSTGNGYPVAAVVTTRAVADAFGREGSFFSSVGGSTLGAAVGVAVLDAIEDEDLQTNARVVGDHLKARLESLVDRHPLVGAVHGLGLYLGVELVRDRTTLEPATDEAAAVCDRMLEMGVVVQPTADHLNVLKVKPPLCLTRGSADFFVDTLDEVLATGW